MTSQRHQELKAQAKGTDPEKGGETLPAEPYPVRELAALVTMAAVAVTGVQVGGASFEEHRPTVDATADVGKDGPYVSYLTNWWPTNPKELFVSGLKSFPPLPPYPSPQREGKPGFSQLSVVVLPEGLVRVSLNVIQLHYGTYLEEPPTFTVEAGGNERKVHLTPRPVIDRSHVSFAYDTSRLNEAKLTITATIGDYTQTYFAALGRDDAGNQTVTLSSENDPAFDELDRNPRKIFRAVGQPSIAESGGGLDI